MSLKTYTVTATGMKSNGNPLNQPFTVEVHEIFYTKETGGDDTLVVKICAKNGSGTVCRWDELEDIDGFNFGKKSYGATPAMTSSKNTDLSNSLENDLDTAAGQGNWS